ncbi:hypothetical protein PoMZ_03907 [Pyricularia oryzae]|uniref:Uncharacterized protein n=1 Tax=Pyricularia oryzae TaxID=318829 RepID=A0A4P7N8E9_PYROR|nr:hypothetical protein PoMZ_03907 [Pyricularia oryzae]
MYMCTVVQPPCPAPIGKVTLLSERRTLIGSHLLCHHHTLFNVHKILAGTLGFVSIANPPPPDSLEIPLVSACLRQLSPLHHVTGAFEQSRPSFFNHPQTPSFSPRVGVRKYCLLGLRRSSLEHFGSNNFTRSAVEL